jgi:hypothetical protein
VAKPEDWQHFLEMAATWDMLAKQRPSDKLAATWALAEATPAHWLAQPTSHQHRWRAQRVCLFRTMMTKKSWSIEVGTKAPRDGSGLQSLRTSSGSLAILLAIFHAASKKGESLGFAYVSRPADRSGRSKPAPWRA